MANIKEIVIVTKENTKIYKLGDSADSKIIRDTQDMNTKLPFNAALYTIAMRWYNIVRKSLKKIANK